MSISQTVLDWMALGSFGVTLPILARVRELLGPEVTAAVARRRK